jgi:hypothetical protein
MDQAIRQQAVIPQHAVLMHFLQLLVLTHEKSGSRVTRLQEKHKKQLCRKCRIDKMMKLCYLHSPADIGIQLVPWYVYALLLVSLYGILVHIPAPPSL